MDFSINSPNGIKRRLKYSAQVNSASPTSSPCSDLISEPEDSFTDDMLLLHVSSPYGYLV